MTIRKKNKRQVRSTGGDYPHRSTSFLLRCVFFWRWPTVRLAPPSHFRAVTWVRTEATARTKPLLTLAWASNPAWRIDSIHHRNHRNVILTRTRCYTTSHHQPLNILAVKPGIGQADARSVETWSAKEWKRTKKGEGRRKQYRRFPGIGKERKSAAAQLRPATRVAKDVCVRLPGPPAR